MTQFGQLYTGLSKGLVNHLEAMIDRLREQLGKQLVVEDLEAAAAGDLADGGGVEAMLVVAVSALDEDAAVTQALGVHLSPHVVQVHTCEALRQSPSCCMEEEESQLSGETIAKGELTAVQGLELMVGLQVRPTPHPAVNYVGQALAVGHLEPAVQRTRDGQLKARSSSSIAPFFFFSFFTRESTAFSAHFSSSSPCFQPSSLFTAGLVKEKREVMDVVECIGQRVWSVCLQGAGATAQPRRQSGWSLSAFVRNPSAALELSQDHKCGVLIQKRTRHKSH
ncbi:hypothetical protein JZ751_023037 [Albula glossodonta]|uniref:Uncharacterized protein n=1 Tax=Albula glossodonta TaxID=121402 RepID=A0A8T2PJ47_9TELE|nr:hypothetical protein JZ751_023037 [Albula glossodonta]